jgi:hypothetical protein
MKRDIFAIVKFVQLIAHVLKQQPIFLRINFKSSLQQSQNKFDSSNGNDSTLVNVNYVPSILEISNVSVRQQSVFFVGVEQGKVLHDNSCSEESLQFKTVS